MRLNTLYPADIIGNEFEANVIGITPLGRFGRLGDLTPVAEFLASNDALDHRRNHLGVGRHVD